MVDDPAFSRRPLGRPPKRSRSDAELGHLARQFGADWVAGDTVQTWLNRHEGRAKSLSRLVRDGWSWADIAKAMFMAGIAYNTGTPIPENTLRNKAWMARRTAKAWRDKDRGQSEFPLPTTAPAPHWADDKPEFECVSMADGHIPTRDETPIPRPNLIQPPADIQAARKLVMERTFGKKS